MDSAEKILVLQTSFLGDVVLTTPLLSALKRRFPSARLSVLCTPQAKPLLEGNPDIHEILTDDKKGDGRGWLGIWRKAKELRQKGFTMALSPHKSFRSGLLLFLARVPRRVGFRKSAGWFFYHHRVQRDPSRHDAERMLSLLQPFVSEHGGDRGELQVFADAGAEETVERLFRSLGISGNGVTFGINPGSVWATKRWTAEGYAELMVRLNERYRCEILLFGGPEDVKVVERIQRLSGQLGISLAGKIALRELVSAIGRCDLFITNDSAPMHIAVARGIPVVAIFCATTRALGFYPYSSRAVVVEKDLPCRPCSSHGGRRCPLGTEDCMRLIRSDDILRAVERLVEPKEERRSPVSDSRLPEVITL